MMVGSKSIIFVLCLHYLCFHSSVVLSQQLFASSLIQEQQRLTLYTEFSESKVKAGSIVELSIRGKIEQGWHIYSTQTGGDLQSLATKITYSPSLVHLPQSRLLESKPITYFDEVIDLTLQVHQHQFVLTQRFKIADFAQVGVQDLSGNLEYFICDNHICSPQQQLEFIAPLEVIP